MNEQTKNERDIWAIFMNAPGPEALNLLEQAQRILTARNVIKPKRPYVKKEKSKGSAA